MNKKILTLILLGVVLLSCFTVSFAALTKEKNKTIGEEQYLINDKLGEVYKKYKIDKKEDKSSGKILAKYEGVEILKKDFDYYKESFAIAGITKTDNEIIEELIIKKLLLKEAEKTVSIDDKEIIKMNDELREKAKKDPDGYEMLKRYIASIGWTEDEYWEKSFPVYKNAYIIGQHKKELREKFINENKDLTHMEMQEKFEKEYEKYKKDLLKNAEIEYFN